MVLVIMPLLLGAIAAALVVSIDNSKSTASRLSDSVDAQLTSAFFVRDVQGAGLITTLGSLALDPRPSGLAGFSISSPQVCGPASVIGASVMPAGNQLLAAFFHPGAASGSAFDVGYWEVGTSPGPYRIVRYFCSLAADFTVSSPVSVAVADNVTYVSPSIQPSQFQVSAADGWVPTVASTHILDPGTTNPGPTITVVSTAGFINPGPSTVNVTTSLGSQFLTGCTVASATTFTNCSGAPINTSDTLSQDSVSAVNFSIDESPASRLVPTSPTEYHYSLTAAPRTETLWGPGPGSNGGPFPSGSPSLLTLSCQGITAKGNTSLTVTGSVVSDCGSVDCSGTSVITTNPPNQVYSYPSGSGTCSPTAGSYEPDPLAPFLPSCLLTQQNAPAPTIETIYGVSAYVLRPGRYTGPVPPTNDHSRPYYLEPGVYELDAGLSLSTKQRISIDPTYADSGQGVLLYIPSTKSGQGCAVGQPGASLNLSAQGAEDLPPLSSTQSKAYFQGNPYLGGVWVWQVAANSNPADLGGGSSATTPNLAYLPSAYVTLHGGPSAGTGAIICAGLLLTGGSTVTLSGPPAQ